VKILMTGFTPRGVGSTKLLYSYMSNTSVITKTLRAAGHEIDHRVVDVNEPLKDKYDVAMIALAVPQSLSSRYVYGALWAAEEFGDRARFFVDDWLLHQFKSQLESGIKDPEKRFYSLDNRHCYDAAKLKTDLWLRWFKHLSRGRYELLIPCFGWAKPRALLPKLENVTPVIFDPTPLALTDPEVFWGDAVSFEGVTGRPMEDREKRWTLAAMRDVGPWLKRQVFDWPIEKYGNKRQGEPILTERDLVSNIYTKNVGIIGAPYEVVKGGGGWRARYIHAAVTNSILFLDPDEGRAAGPPYDLMRSVVERASTGELYEIAARQKQWLLSHTWSLDQLTTNLEAYVRPK
jgi:hypothetical protein